MSQVEQLIKHFTTAGSITGVEAAAVYKIRALPRRISDLRERGFVIEDTWRKDATGQRYKRYTMIAKRSVK